MLILLLLPSALAATWVVDPAGGDFATLAAAVEAAVDGDVLSLAAGTFAEDVALGGKSLSLQGAGRGLTVIEGSVLAIDALGSASLSLSDLTLSGAARAVDADGDVELEDVDITEVGREDVEGSALRLTGGSLRWSGGGVDQSVAFRGAIFAVEATVDLVDVSFSRAEGESGAALWMEGGSLNAAGVTFAANFALGSGGCIYATGAALSLVDSTFSGCVAGSVGGAVRLAGGSLELQGAEFAQNVGPGAVDVYTTEASVTVNDTRFESPSLTPGAAGEYCEENTASALFDLGGHDATLTGITTWLGDGTALEQFCPRAIDVRDGGSVTLGDYTDETPLNPDATDVWGAFTATGAHVTLSGTVSEAGGHFGVYSPDLSVGPVEWLGAGRLTVRGAGSVHDLHAVGLSHLYLYGDEGALTVAGLDAEVKVLRVQQAVSLETTRLECDHGLIFAGGGNADDSIRMVDSRVAGCAVVADAADLTLEGFVSTGSSRPGESGGALEVLGGNVYVHQGWFGDNEAERGGAVAVAGGSATLEASVFFGNSADEGGALWISGGALTVAGVVLQENLGGGLYVAGGFPSLRQVTAVGNEGEAQIFADSGSMELRDVIAAGSPDAGFAATGSAAAATAVLAYNDVWDNAAGGYAGSLTDLTGTEGNLAADPQFVAYTRDGVLRGDDLHLQPGSPCIDAGVPEWTDADGSRVDIGAFGGEWGAQIDYDGDGILAVAGDCDDSDALVHPEAVEVLGDGIDQDCDGADSPVGDTGDTGTGDDSGEEPGDTAETGETASPTNDGDDPDPRGCGCTHGAVPGAGAMLLGALTLLGTRRGGGRTRG